MADKRFSEAEDAQLQQWQRRYFEMNSNKNFDNKYLQVDCLRGHMQQISISQQTKLLSSEAGSYLLLDYGKKYAKLMEDKDGTDNYSDEVLHLCRFQKSDVSKWSSSLDPNNLTSVPVIQEFLQRRKQATGDVKHVEFMRSLGTAARSNKIVNLINVPSSPAQPSVNRELSSSSSTSNTSSNTSVYANNGGGSIIFDRSQFRDPNHYQTLPPFNHHQPIEITCDQVKRMEERDGVSRWGGGGGAKRKWGSRSSPEDDCKRSKDVPGTAFRSAKHLHAIENAKNRSKGGAGELNWSNNGPRQALGNNSSSLLRRPFVSPMTDRKGLESGRDPGGTASEFGEDPRLVNVDPKMIERVRNEIMDSGPPVKWDDIAGLEFVKKTIKEIVVLPLIRPDIFKDLLAPAKGLLLFGPPGNGKTLIGKCITSQAKATFFSVSSSTLTSKWIGDGEKMVHALLAVARCSQPAVIFIDEIDSLLSQRSDSEHEASRRMKTEFLVQLDGTKSAEADRVLFVGATNRPHELDEAVRRRFTKRLYLPLPEVEARVVIIKNLLSGQHHSISEEQFSEIGCQTEGYSGADMANLCREAALGPIRQMSPSEIEFVAPDQVGPILYRHFQSGLSFVKASVSKEDLQMYMEFNRKYGCTIADS